MHELSVAQGILDLVRRHVPELQAGAVRTVTIRLGRLSGVVADSLDFCFGAIVAGTPYCHAALAIEHVPTRARCADCAAEFEVEGVFFRCAACSGPHVRLVSGDDLQVVAVELDEVEAEGT